MFAGEADITPEPMAQSAFSEMVLKACGKFGSKVDPRNVQRLVEAINPEVIKELVREFPDYSSAQMRELLTRIWTNANGFEHVFCGQPSNQKLGGLHYGARYFELQQKGLLCRLDNNLPNEQVLPQSVFTIGTISPGGVMDRKKGFSTRQSAEDLFFEAGRAFLRNCLIESKDRRVCVTPFFKDGSFGSRLVCQPNIGIITFYPLASVPKGSSICR
ncbi:MAG: EndoU domain-containing protein [Oligoflexia bacterium]|nr:EndoU domain-containing protein [Oligoflexia bacterium]